MGRSFGGNNATLTGLLPSPLALFRYLAPGVLQPTDIAFGYFSIDGGVTDLRDGMGENGGDLADWGDTTDDIVGFGQAGTAQIFTPIDVRVMAALGWAPSNDDFWTGTSAPWTLSLFWTNGVPTATSNVFIPQGTPLVLAPIAVAGLNVSAGAAVDFIVSGASTVTGALSNSGLIDLFAGVSTSLDVGGAVTNNGEIRVELNSLFSAEGAVSGTGFINLLSGGEFGAFSPSAGGLDDSGAKIQGAGSIVIGGFGPVKLSASNSYTGGTSVFAASTVSIGAGTALGTGALALNANSTLALTAAFSLNNAITLNGAAKLNVTTPTDFLNGKISGSGSLSISGGGKVSITNAGNSYNGGTTVNAATLVVNSASVLNTGTVALQGGATVEFFNYTFTDAITLSGANTLQAASGNVSTLTGTVSNGSSAGVLAVRGGGTLVLSGANTYTGGTEVQNGATLSISSDANIGTGALTLDGGSKLKLSGNPGLNTHITLAGAATIDSSGVFSDFFAPIGGAGSLTLLTGGGGSPGLDAANTYTGGTTATGGGELFISNDDALGTGKLTLDHTNLILALDTTVANAIDVAGVDFFVLNGHTPTLSGIIADGAVAGGIIVGGGSGTLTLTGANTFTGGAKVETGTTLSISAANNIGAGALTLDGGSTLNLTAAFDLGAAVTLSGGVATIVNGPLGFDISAFSGVISGSGAISFVGGDIAALNGANTFTGGVTATGDAWVELAGSANGLGSGDLTLLAGARFILGASNTIGNNIHIDSHSFISVQSGDDCTLSGVISDAAGVSGSVVVDSGGVLRLAGANTYSGGTEVQGGATLAISAANNIGAGALTLDDGAKLDVTATFGANFGITLAGAATIDATGSNGDFFGVIDGAGSLTLVTTGGNAPGLEGVNSYAGGTTVTGSGAIFVGNSHALGTGTVTLDHVNAQLSFADTLANAIDVDGLVGFDAEPGTTPTLSGAIADGAAAGSVFVFGGGVLTLSGANTYTGGTTVNSGTTLAISGAGKLGTGGVTLQSGATLSLGAGAAPKITGTSSFAGTVSGAGTWSLGAGTATIASTATVSVAKWSLSGAGVTLGKALTYSGAFTMGAGSALTLSTGVLTLNGATTLSGGATAGTQKLSLQNGATINGAVTIGGSAGLLNAATLLETGSGAVTFGDASGAAVAVTNLASGVWNIVNNQGVALGSAANSKLFNQGLLEKTVASGTSTIAATLVSTGTLTAATGTLNLTGANNLISGAMTGAGQIEIGGGVTSFNAGATASVARLYVAGAGTALRVVTNLSYGGNLTETGGASLSVATGDTLTLTGVSSFSGAVIGGGTLAMTGGSATVASPASLTVANWTSSGTALTILGVHKQFGSFSAANETMTLNAQLITGGATTLTHLKLAGTGTLQVNNTTTVTGGLTLGGSTSLINVGKATQSGGMTLGDSAGGATQFRNAGGAVWTLSDGAGVVKGNAAATALNFGTVQKTSGAGTATFGVAMANNSTLAVSGGGRLDFAGAITGTGAASISGASRLEFDAAVASGQTITFKGANGVLDLHDFGEFSGRISGFDTTNFGSADTILVGGPWAFVGFNQSSGLMTFADGATQHSVHLLGSYIAADFHHSVVGGVTQVTYG